MNGRRLDIRWIAGLALAAGLLATLALLRVRNAAAPGGETVAPEPSNRIRVEADGRLNIQELERLSWADLARTARASFESPKLPDQLLAATIHSTNPPVRYLRGLILVARGDARKALEAFDSVPLATIPAAHLYAPYRVHGELRLTQPNPYRAPLLAALGTRNLPPLLAARVEAREGKESDALSDYLRSNPADWTRHDLELLRGLTLNPALRPEADTLIRAALRGGRIPEALRPGFVEALKTKPAPQALGTMRTETASFLRQHPDIQSAAVTGAVRQLDFRQAFLKHDFARLLSQNQATEPMNASDETVLLLVLAAARQADRPAFDQWSQELRRRHPEPEVNRWLKELRNDIR